MNTAPPNLLVVGQIQSDIDLDHDWKKSGIPNRVKIILGTNIEETMNFVE